MNKAFSGLGGLGIGDWGLPNPQSPIPNPQVIKNQLNRIDN